MSSNSPDANEDRAAGLQSMLARLHGMMRGVAADQTGGDEEVLPTWDAFPSPPLATPVAQPVDGPFEDAPLALPVDVDETPTVDDPPPAQPVAALPAAPVLCRVCGMTRQGDADSCADCGYYFKPEDLIAAAPPGVPPVLLQGRYEVGEPINARDNLHRFKGFDHGVAPPAPVVILRQPAAPEPLPVAIPAEDDEAMPVYDDALSSSAPITAVMPARPAWPTLAWERGLLRTLEQPSLPRVLDSFQQDGFDYLVEEVPAGRPLWDAWDDPDSTAELRFGWLHNLAETLHGLHLCHAMLEGLRPELVVIAPDGRARLVDVAELLPLPLPEGTPLRGTLYTAPELLAGQADARADLYSFGAMLYALHVGRELSEIDFDLPGQPKPFLPRFPDAHPAFGRLMNKTFRREVETRFPSDEATREDPTGFVELQRTLRVLGRSLDNVRLEVAAWTTTGMVRTGNEDAFALLHACESRQDDVGESVLVLLADGMGGYEAGEVAAALTIQMLRQHLLAQKPFTSLGGASAFTTEPLGPWSRAGHIRGPVDAETLKQLIRTALKDVNRQVFAAARTPGTKRRGMGCTAEAVYLDGRQVVVGHVGDSRTYHLHEGRFLQLTRDQTLVNRLVELGTLTPEEAAFHPRRNELQQAVGGQPDVEPGMYSNPLRPGDWVVVCSDGVSNHISDADLKHMLQSEATSAEMAARRLVNLANIEGATDNATVVVIRAS
jgi:protein phosphatase